MGRIRLLTLATLAFCNLLLCLVYLRSHIPLLYLRSLPTRNESAKKEEDPATFYKLPATTAASQLIAEETRPQSTMSPPNMTPELHSHPYKYLINPDLLCLETSPNVKIQLVILVCSGAENFQQRAAIRKTWGSAAGDNAGRVRLAFLLGVPNNATVQDQVFEEAANYSDVIQEDFLDAYRNLTLKSVMMLRWVSRFCSAAQWVLKTDDDMYIHVGNLLHALALAPLFHNVMYGVVFRGARPDRDTTAKWFVPESEFAGSVFPSYLSGTGYVMSGDVVPRLFAASLKTPFMAMEDIFITGLCASKSGVRRQTMRGFSYLRRTPSGCAFRDVISGHHVTVQDMHKIWTELQSGHSLKCKKT